MIGVIDMKNREFIDDEITNIQIRITKGEKNKIIKQAKDNGFDTTSGYIKYLLRMERKINNDGDK